MKKPAFIEKWSTNLKSRAKKLKSDIPAIFLALKDKETPLAAKIFAAATVAYALPVVLIWVLVIWCIVRIFI